MKIKVDLELVLVTNKKSLIIEVPDDLSEEDANKLAQEYAVKAYDDGEFEIDEYDDNTHVLTSVNDSPYAEQYYGQHNNLDEICKIVDIVETE